MGGEQGDSRSAEIDQQVAVSASGADAGRLVVLVETGFQLEGNVGAVDTTIGADRHDVSFVRSDLISSMWLPTAAPLMSLVPKTPLPQVDRSPRIDQSQFCSRRFPSRFTAPGESTSPTIAALQ